MVVERQAFSGRLISHMARSTIVVIPSAGVALATTMSSVVLADPDVPLAWDYVTPLAIILPAAVCWPVLRLLEIPRAWLVAALGGMFMGVVWRLAGPSFGTHITGLAVLLGGTVAYPSAVMVAVPGTPVVWRVLPPALFAGLFWFVA